MPKLDGLDAEQRVSAGERFLKKKRPEWRRRVRWGSDAYGLVMSDPNHCLISQIEGCSFKLALRSLGISRDEAIAFGFLRSDKDPVTFYGDLQHCWQRRRDY